MPTPHLPTITGRTFADTETVVLDDKRYESCNFDGCTVIYHGRYTELVNCIFGPNVAWALQGSAMETVLALQSCGFDFVHLDYSGRVAQKIALVRDYPS